MCHTKHVPVNAHTRSALLAFDVHVIALTSVVQKLWDITLHWICLKARVMVDAGLVNAVAKYPAAAEGFGVVEPRVLALQVEMVFHACTIQVGHVLCCIAALSICLCLSSQG